MTMTDPPAPRDANLLDDASRLDDAAARSGVYRLLAKLVLSELDSSIVSELNTPPLSDAFQSVGGTLPVNEDVVELETLAIDYCRIFVGPAGHLPPFQSVWQSGQFQSATTASMQSFLEIAGYGLQQVPSGMMVDHLGLQLDLMGHILGEAAKRRADPDHSTQVLELAGAFFERHLGWPTELLSAAERRAETDFYRSTIKITEQFLQSEKFSRATP